LQVQGTNLSVRRSDRHISIYLTERIKLRLPFRTNAMDRSKRVDRSEGWPTGTDRWWELSLFRQECVLIDVCWSMRTDRVCWSTCVGLCVLTAACSPTRMNRRMKYMEQCMSPMLGQRNKW